MASAASLLDPWLHPRAANLAGAVYGTVLVTSVVVGASASEQTPLGLLTAIVAVTTVVFWLAHVDAHAPAHSVRTGGRATWVELRGRGINEWPLLPSALPPPAFLLLGQLGPYGRALSVCVNPAFGLVVVLLTAIVSH